MIAAATLRELVRDGVRRRGSHRRDCPHKHTAQPFTWVRSDEELSRAGTKSTRGQRHTWWILACEDEAQECGAELLVREDVLCALVGAAAYA